MAEKRGPLCHSPQFEVVGEMMQPECCSVRVASSTDLGSFSGHGEAQLRLRLRLRTMAESTAAGVARCGDRSKRTAATEVTQVRPHVRLIPAAARGGSPAERLKLFQNVLPSLGATDMVGGSVGRVPAAVWVSPG